MTDHRSGQISRSRVFLSVSLVVLSLVVPSGSTISAQEMEEERFSAFATHVGTGPSGATSLRINITRWTTDAERDHLLSVLVNEGHEAAAEALRDHEQTGYVRFPSIRTRFPTTRLYYARQFRQGNTRIIRLATDRPIGFLETMSGRRSLDYDLSIIELRLNENGEGEGALAVGVEIAVDRESNRLVIESWSSAPVRLSEVRKTN